MPISWPEVHGAVTHFPVALLITAFVFDLGAALFRHPPWRTVSFWLLVGGGDYGRAIARGRVDDRQPAVRPWRSAARDFSVASGSGL